MLANNGRYQVRVCSIVRPNSTNGGAGTQYVMNQKYVHICYMYVFIKYVPIHYKQVPIWNEYLHAY